VEHTEAAHRFDSFAQVELTKIDVPSNVISRVSTPILGVPRENDTPELSSPYLSCRETPCRRTAIDEIATLMSIRALHLPSAMLFFQFAIKTDQLQRTVKVHRSIGVISSEVDRSNATRLTPI
jgi:hypothetical protein